jgi:cytoskeletal protein RodZ
MASNGFIRKKVGSLTLGEKLKKLRSEGRISLAEASKSTKIQIKYLEYLESGEYEKLPAKVYVKGFLRSYANFLGISESYLIKLYEREQGIRENIKNTSQEKKLAEPIKFPRFIITPRIIVMSAVGLLVFGCFFYLYKEMGNFVNTPRLVVIKPVSGSVVESKSVYVSGVSEKDSEVFINDQPTMVNDKGEFNENVGLQDGLNTISVKAKNKFGKVAEQNITLQFNGQNTEAVNSSSDNGQNTDNTAKNSGIKIDVYVQPDPTWISVEEDGNLAYSGTLLPGATQTFEAKDKISITSGKGRSTFIKINGVDKGMLSDSPGIVRDVTFTADTKY